MCKSKAPDTRAADAAAAQAAANGAATLAWYQQKDREEAPMRARLNEMALEVGAQQLVSSKNQDRIAADYDSYSKRVFRPLEEGLAAEAVAYDTPDKRQTAADEAMADTNIAFNAQSGATARTLAANGVNPGSTRAMSVNQGMAVDQAVANAGAARQARKGVETVGRAMRTDAANLGRGLASSQATSAGLALQAGNSAVANAGVPLAASQAATNQVGKGYLGAMQGQQIAGNIYGQSAQLHASQNDDGIWGTLGKLGGAAISKYSDETLKTDISPMSDEEALAATNKTPVKKWKYDPAEMAARGIPMEADDYGEKIGPMAQDVNKNMGEEAAPGGTKLNMVTMNGIAMKSIQAVDKKVEKLAKQLSSMSAMIRSGQLTARA